MHTSVNLINRSFNLNGRKIAIFHHDFMEMILGLKISCQFDKKLLISKKYN